jgi:hypothetical protein
MSLTCPGAVSMIDHAVGPGIDLHGVEIAACCRFERRGAIGGPDPQFGWRRGNMRRSEQE